MGLTRGATVTTKAVASAGSTNFNITGHTTDAGTDYLVVFIYWAGTTTFTVSTIKWNGVAMTLLGSDVVAGACKVFAYGLAAPAIQTGTVTITISAGARGGAVAVNYSGVDQTTPVGTVATNHSTSNNTTPTVTVTSQTGGVVIAGAVCNNGDTTTVTAGSGQTDLANFVGSATAGASSSRSLTSDEAGAASVVMDGTWSTNRAWATVGVPINPYVAAAPLGKLTYMGSTQKVRRCAWW